MLGTVSTCCWSHDGRILLVAPSGEAVIHAFQLVEEINASPRFLRSHSTAAVRTKYADSELGTKEHRIRLFLLLLAPFVRSFSIAWLQCIPDPDVLASHVHLSLLIPRK